MTDLRIQRLRKRYRLPASAADERRRLDRVLAAALDDRLLDAALDRAGVPTTDEICLRNVSASVRLRRSDRDDRLAVDWSIALAEAIAAKLQGGGADVVRYRSRHHALLELVRHASHGDLRRAWAWRQLGLWVAADAMPPAAAGRAGLEALANHAEDVVAILQVIAEDGGLPRLLADTPPAIWIRLAVAALAAAGASEPARRAVAEDPPRLAPPADRLDRIICRSIIAGAAGPVTPDKAMALGALALLEREPELAATADAVALVRALGTALASAADASPKQDAAPPSEPRDVVAAPGPAPASRVALTREEEPPPLQDADERPSGLTFAGGLLFLLHIARTLDLPSLVRADAALERRPLRWVLHHLAIALAGVESTDPAALAFAGLAPMARRPIEQDAPATPPDLTAVRQLRTAIADALRTRLGVGPQPPEAELLERVVRRHARIVADPGWIEARFALGDAETGLRRAGLDLDPGWVPWLGVVVRFVYE